MTVKTRFTEKVLSRILAEYDLGGLTGFSHFKAGNVQTNILIKTTKGRFVLRYYENRSEKSVRFEEDFLSHLSRHKYPCAMPIRKKDRSVMGIYRNKPYILFSYLTGRHLKNINDRQLQDMIKYLALLHNISKGRAPVNYTYREPRTIKFCLAVAKKEAKRFKDCTGERRLRVVKEGLARLDLPETLPKGIIHGDFDKANIKFLGDGVSGVLDFDDATYTFLIYDLGVILLYWTRFYVKRFDFNKARKVISIYQRYRPLSGLEKRHVFDALQLATLMIMSWLLHDEWKGRDLFNTLSRILDELNAVGRDGFYKKVFQ
jgi:Ser/Thr protein kinase RdoA (MazF antagonist)